MSRTEFMRPQPIVDFQGENRHFPSFLLPPNMSPDALNNDYYRRTARKRNGLKRLDDRPVQTGGVFIRNTDSNDAYGGNFTFNPSGSFALSFAVQVTDTDVAYPTPRICLLGTEGVDGFAVKWIPSTGTFRLTFETSGGTKTLNVSGVSAAIIYNLMVIYFVGGATNTYALYVDTLNTTVQSTDTYTSAGMVSVRFGYDTSPQTLAMHMDELRWWDLSTLDDAGFASWLTHWTTDMAYRRELTAAEQALPTLYRYWQFGGTNPKNDLKGVPATQFLLEGGTDNFAYEARWARGLVNSHYDPVSPRVTNLIRHEGRLYRFSNTEIFSVYNHITWNSLHNTLLGPGDTMTPEFVSLQPWATCRYRNRLIGVHPDIGCFYTQANTQFWKLTPAKPDMTGVTATDSGGGTGPGAGTYVFKFFYYNSTNDVVSVQADLTVSVTMASANAIQFNNFAAVRTTRPVIEGVDKLRVFRTKDSGTTFYYVDDISLQDSPAATFTSLDINKADSALAEADSERSYRYDLAGSVSKARACFEHRGYLVLVGAPDGSVEKPNDIVWSEPGRTDLFYYRNRLEILPDDDDYLVGGISVEGGALLARRYTLVGLYGASPSTWDTGSQPLSRSLGCLSPNTLAASDSFAYCVSDEGIVQVPLPLGSGPARNVSQDAFMELFDDLDLSSVNTACGAYYTAKNQYWCSFDTRSSGRVTLIFNERTGGISMTDLEVEAYAQNTPDEGPRKLIGCWRGYIVQLDYGGNEGGTKVVSGADSTPVLTGVVTAGDAHSLTDSTQNWPTTSQNTISATYTDACSGMAGLWVTKISQADGSVETRRIFFNSLNRLWVQDAWTANPVATDIYVIAAIPWHWRSPKLIPHQDPSEQHRIHRIAIFMEKQWPARYLTFDMWHDGTAELAHSAVSTGARRNEILINGRAREWEFQISNNWPDTPVEIIGYQLTFEEAAVRP